MQPDGTLAELRGKVGEAVTIEQGVAARLVGLVMLGSLQREPSELERITVWLRMLGMVNVSPGATQLAGVINGFFGSDRGRIQAGARRARAVGGGDGGVTPYGVAVEIEAEVEMAESTLAT